MIFLRFCRRKKRKDKKKNMTFYENIRAEQVLPRGQDWHQWETGGDKKVVGG
jgi:hypothetical protein